MDLTLQDEAQVGDEVGMSIATEGQGQGHNYFWHPKSDDSGYIGFYWLLTIFFFFLGFSDLVY